jgi:selenocysteine lyase/cysteine desulfurase
MVEHADSGAAVAELARRNLIVDKRGSYVRVSPHFYNCVDENAEFVQAFAKI